MINGETASKMGIKFLEEEKCFKLAGGLEQGDCTNETFEEAIRTLGKKRVAELYKRLPKQLKIYVLWQLHPTSNNRFYDKLEQIWNDYRYLEDWNRPDRCRQFKKYCREAEEALLKYLGAK